MNAATKAHKIRRNHYNSGPMSCLATFARFIHGKNSFVIRTLTWTLVSSLIDTFLNNVLDDCLELWKSSGPHVQSFLPLRDLDQTPKNSSFTTHQHWLTNTWTWGSFLPTRASSLPGEVPIKDPLSYHLPIVGRLTSVKNLSYSLKAMNHTIPHHEKNWAKFPAI